MEAFQRDTGAKPENSGEGRKGMAEEGADAEENHSRKKEENADLKDLSSSKYIPNKFATSMQKKAGIKNLQHSCILFGFYTV